MATPPTHPEPHLYACICHAVTTAEVDAAVALGATSVKQVRKATGAGTACGTCVKRLSCLLAAARVADSAPPEAVPEAERLPVSEPVAVAVPVREAEPVRQLEAARDRKSLRELGTVVQHAPHCPAALPALG